ncbi:MAG: hypothetical protein ACFFD4_04780 [Candidatus Odinarchaeota archaeon]
MQPYDLTNLVFLVNYQGTVEPCSGAMARTSHHLRTTTGDLMKFDGFRAHLQGKNITESKIAAALSIVSDFNDYLDKRGKSTENATRDDFYEFSTHLIDNGMNNQDNYVNLLRFGHFTNNNVLIIATMEILDGSEMIANFSKRLTEEFGVDTRNEIFDGIAMPPLGLPPKKKPEILKKLVERFLMKFDEQTGAEFFAKGLRDKYTDWYESARKSFLQLENIDAYLDYKHQKMVRTLEQHLQEKTLFFTQAVDEQVIEHVKNDRTIEAGIRQGNTVMITKIPYMTSEYLNAKDERKKKYYFCHNPWIREALLDEDQPVPPVFCNCSGGYYKDFWEGVLKQPVRVELLESVIAGNETCKFALHLPEEEKA